MFLFIVRYSLTFVSEVQRGTNAAGATRDHSSITETHEIVGYLLCELVSNILIVCKVHDVVNNLLPSVSLLLLGLVEAVTGELY